MCFDVCDKFDKRNNIFFPPIATIPNGDAPDAFLSAMGVGIVWKNAFPKKCLFQTSYLSQTSQIEKPIHKLRLLRRIRQTKQTFFCRVAVGIANDATPCRVHFAHGGASGQLQGESTHCTGTAQIATTGLCSVAVPRRLLMPDSPLLPLCRGRIDDIHKRILGKQIASLLWCRTDVSIRNDGTGVYWKKRFGRLPSRSIPNNSGLASARKWRDLTGWGSLVYSSFSGRCVANKCRGHGSRLDNNEGLCSR